MSPLPLRLEPGQDLRRALEDAAAALGSAFVVCGIGSLVNPTLRLAGAAAQTSLEGDFEILSLAGTITPQGAHLHMAVAGRDGRVVGGHVCHGNRVRTTAEVLLVRADGWELARELDPATGYRELVAKPAAKGQVDAA